MAGTGLDLSVIVPLYNEADNVGLLHREIDVALSALGQSYEILFVDDGSEDGTWDVLEALAVGDPHVRVFRFRRNYGQTPAMQAGFDHAQGRVVVTMDGDLQNDPADIGRFLAEIESGHDVVCGWRRTRRDRLISRKIPSWIANRLISAITGIRIHDNGCSLKAYRSEFIRRLRLYSEMHRFIPAMLSMSGARYAEIEVHHRARRFGRSKYGLSRTGKVLSDLVVVRMLTGFVTRPAVWFGWMSLPFLLLSLVFIVASGIQYARSETVESMPIVFPGVAVLVFFAFLHLILLGMIAELVLLVGEVRESRIVVADVIDDEGGAG